MFSVYLVLKISIIVAFIFGINISGEYVNNGIKQTREFVNEEKIMYSHLTVTEEEVAFFGILERGIGSLSLPLDVCAHYGIHDLKGFIDSRLEKMFMEKFD